jgi:hypothetical protein
MKKLGKRLTVLLMTLAMVIGLLPALALPASAATTLSAGDIAFVGLNSDGDDEFSFLLLKDITAGTAIYITDKGWNDATGFQTIVGDGIWLWSTASALSAGTVVHIKTTNNGNIEAGSLAASTGTVEWNEDNGTVISYSGDQLFLYQGSAASPTFITGIHWNVEAASTDADWDGSAAATQTSALPNQLTNGVNAIWVHDAGPTEYDNFRYKSSATTSGTPAVLSAAINNIANWDVDLTNATAYTLNPFPFTFTVSVPAPTVTGISPTSGPMAGGTGVTITGTNFTGATAVTIGGVAATSITVVNDTTITATTPVHAAGAVDVIVTTPGGPGTGTGLFTFTAPPAGTTLQTVDFETEGSGYTVTGVPVFSDDDWWARIKSDHVNLDDPSFSNQQGNYYFYGEDTDSGRTANEFSYVTLNTVTITGYSSLEVKILIAGNDNVDSSYEGTESLTIEYSVDGGPFIKRAQYIATAGDTCLSEDANMDGIKDGTEAIMKLSPDFKEYSYSIPSTGTELAIRIAANINSGREEIGFDNIRILGTLTPAAAPTVTSVSPTSGATAGGTSVTITGTNFTGATAVTIGGVSATGISVVNDTTITATTPAHAVGAVDVTVTTPGGTGTGVTLFTYTAANTAPTFIGATTLTVAANAPATDIKGLLHVSDTDVGQTLTWSQSAAPFHGALTFASATANSGGADLITAGTITYTPTAGYSGSDSFTVQVSDGTATATRTINVTVASTTGIVTEHFSDEASNTGHFTNSGFLFTLAGGHFTIANELTYGWTGLATDDWFADNFSSLIPSAGVVGSIQISSGTFRAHSIYIFPGESGSFVSNSGNVIIRGKLGGSTEFTTTILSTAINTAGHIDSGYTFVDLSTYNTIAIDTLEFELTDSLRYLAIDAFKHESTAAAAPAPTVTGIAPNSGPMAGGTGVTITGTNLTGATAVTIGGVAATGVTVVNATTITATTPAGTAGAKNVVVTTPGGTGTGVNLFTYTVANTAPTFVQAGAGSLTVNQNSGAADITGLLHVSDTDAGQTLTWSQAAGGAPSQGTLTFAGATADSGGADLITAGTMTYTPTLGFTGADSFSVQVWDGTATATRTINVTVRSTDAGLASVAGQTDVTPGAETGADTANAITWGVNVPTAKATLGRADIVPAANATYNLYADAAFGTEVTGADTVALTSGGATTVYLKVTAQDTTTVKYYAVTVNRANAAPTVDNLNGDSAAYVEGGATVLLDNSADAAVSDSDSADFNGGNVTAAITANRVSGEDVLSVRNTGTGAGQIGVSGTDVTYGGTTIGTIAGGTGTDALVITLNGNATPAGTSALLRALTYQNTNGSEPGTSARTVSVTVSDGDGGTSASAAVTVGVTGVNDAPTATVTALNPNFTAGGAAVKLFNCPSVSTVESLQKISQITVTVSNLTNGADEILYADGTNVALTNGNSVTTTSGIMCAVSVASGTATVTFTKAGNIPASGAGGADGLINWLNYLNTSAAPTPGNRVVTLISMRDDGGTADGGADITTLNIASTVTVTGDTTAPTVSVTAGTTAGGDGLVSITEKAAGFNVVARSSEATGTLYVVPSGTAKNIGAITGAAIGLAALTAANTDKTIAITAGYAGVMDGTSYAVYAVDGAGNISDISATAFTADLTAPTVTSVTGPANGSYKAGQTLSFTVNFNEAVTRTVASPHLHLDIGGAVVNAIFTGGSGTSALTFSYTVVNGNDTNGIDVISPIDDNGCSIKDAAGNDMTNFALNNVGSTAGVLVDTSAPTVSSVSVPANATYTAGQNLDFTVNLNEAVTVNTAGGTPRISIVIGAVTRYADYLSGSGTAAPVFRYTVQSGDSDSDGISVGALSLEGGTLSDAAGNNAVLNLNSVGSTTSVLVDATVRTVTLSVNNASITENGGVATVTATLSAASSSNVTVTLRYSGTATGGGTHYTASGTTITITAGNTTNTATITAVNNAVDETDKTVVVDITGVTNGTESGTQQVTVTITDDDAPPSLSISDPSVAEGNAGTANLTFTVTLSAASGKAVSVDYATADGTATAGSDYTNKSGTLTFAPGETSKTVAVTVAGDTTTEASETVLLNLSNPVNATLAKTQGAGTIADDDTLPPPPPPDDGGTGGNTGGDAATNVEVNGESYSAGTSDNSTNGEGQAVTTVTVDTAQLQDILEGQGQGATVTIPIETGADVAAGVLTGDMVDTMEENGATLVIQTENATYTLPASEIDINAISGQLGTNVSLSDITVTVSVSAPSDDMVTVIADAANEGGYTLVVPAVEFTVSCTYGDQTVDVTTFDAYVDRTILIPDGVDPNMITTAVVVDADGTPHSVPTEIVYDTATGHYYALIHSLTNSIYTVIYNPVEFADVTTHWAKDAINNMGSRLVVTGIGNNNFAPDRDITRAEFAAVIVRALGLEPGLGKSAFTDVKPTDWFAGYVETAVSYGLITGYDNGAFGPGDKITREQAMTVVARAMKLTGLKVSLSSGEAAALLGAFADGGSVSGYASDGMASCLKSGVLTGKDGSELAAKDNITRAEVAVIIERLLKLSGLI